MAWAVTCNEEAMINRFVDNATEVNFDGLSISGSLSDGGLNPRDFADRYDLMTTLLSLPPGRQDAGESDWYYWPKVPTSDAEWQHLVDIGLIAQEGLAERKELSRIPLVLIHESGQILNFSDGSLA